MTEFYIDIENGEIVQKRLMRKKFTLVDGSYKISIKPGKRRSNKSNAYYWGVVIPYVYEGLREAGFEKVIDNDDAHLVCKSLFLKQIEERNGIKIEKAGSSAKLTKKEFGEYIEAITIWAFDYLSVVIPAPNQQLDLDLT